MDLSVTGQWLWRAGVSTVLGLATCPPIAAQTNGFTVAGYLAPRYTAPDDAPAQIVVAGHDEPGERLIVTGRTLDGQTPVAHVSLYVFHTDAGGRYATDTNDLREAELNPRLHGALRTDAGGRYQFDTIRPGGYGAPLGPAHVHYVVNAPGYEPLLLALQFEDDPIAAAQKGKPPLDADAFTNGPCKARPDCVLTQPVTRDAHGIAHVVRDIQMVRVR
jgi:protocatechuate 3,4-dioxygenase beta subunit